MISGIMARSPALSLSWSHSLQSPPRLPPCLRPGRGDLEVVELLAVASDPEVVEHVGVVEGRQAARALVEGPLVVADLELLLEVDELGADPDVQPVDAGGGDVDQVA